MSLWALIMECLGVVRIKVSIKHAIMQMYGMVPREAKSIYMLYAYAGPANKT